MTLGNLKTSPAESRRLMRRSAWCGVVCSLAVLLTALNAFPPFNIHYQVRSEIVISESRLEQLQQTVQRDLESVQKGELKEAHLVSARVLDRGFSPTSQLDGTTEDLALVEVNSVWMHRASDDAHQDWLTTLTRSTQPTEDHSQIARQRRTARWEADVAKQYLERHEFLADYSPPSSTGDGRTFELANHRSSISASLASHRPASHLPSIQHPNSPQEALSRSPSTAAGTQTSPAANHSEARSKLAAELASAVQRARETEAALQLQIEQSAGLLQIASPPETTARSQGIPFWMAASVLVLGLATGSLTGWVQHRLQSGGAHIPKHVAKRLEIDGIPQLGEIHIPSDQVLQRDWLDVASRRANEASRRTGRHLIQIGEWVLGFWILFIGLRIIADPMWRNILLESPLAAFGRVLVGLP